MKIAIFLALQHFPAPIPAAPAPAPRHPQQLILATTRSSPRLEATEEVGAVLDGDYAWMKPTPTRRPILHGTKNPLVNVEKTLVEHLENHNFNSGKL